MAVFKDLRGQDWAVDFTVATCRKLKSITGLDFANAHDGKAVSEIQANDDKMVQVLWLLCDEQSKKNGINDEDSFLTVLDGNVLQAAQDAIEEALVSFTRPERRAALQTIFDKKREAMDKAVALAVSKVQAVDLDAAITAEMKRLTPGS